MKEIKIGKKYNKLAFPSLVRPDVEEVTVRKIYEINGIKIVRYSVYPWPFRIYYDIFMEDFITQIEL